MTRLFAVLILCLAALPARAEPITIRESFTIHSDILGQDRQVNIYLPPSYAEGNKAYPVLYLLDGGVGEDFLHIAGIATLSADWRGIRDYILVGVAGIDRYHELTSPTSVDFEQKRLPTNGGAADFRKYLRDELVPWVKGRYRTTDETVLMGESLAGLFVAETFLHEPTLFEGYVAVSPSLWWNKEALAKAAPKLLAKPGFPAGRRLFITAAQDDGEDTFAALDTLEAALAANPPKGLKLTVRRLDDESHATTLHPSALMAVRQFFAVPQ